MLARFEGERREFIAQVLRQTRKAKTWVHIDLDQAARAIGQPRDRIVRAMDYLAEQRLIELRAEGVRQTYRLLEKPADLDALADDLFRRLVEREQREIGRLAQVLALAGRDGCQTAMLAEHFGERLEQPCGHCSWCTGGRKPVQLLPRREVLLNDRDWRRAIALAAENRDVLGEPRALAALSLRPFFPASQCGPARRSRPVRLAGRCAVRQGARSKRKANWAESGRS